MAYQSLYRRYRPQRFAEVKGQQYVTTALRNAVREGRVAHAYLFSGPRGTGKTSTARILAKALNCAAPVDGEPDDVCESCRSVVAGTSLDVFELDAASNNGVDAMRDLVARAALGTSGRWKVYIIDEVHMLSPAASNALLKTLEEPPGHVVFVLATTDPGKVLPTVRSRTQHFEFRLLPADLLAEHLRWVVADAGLTVPADAIDAVARKGNGSARDALSALDQAAAGGAVEDQGQVVDELVDALCARDAGASLVAAARWAAAGNDPRQLAREALEQLRQAFLAVMAPGLVDVPEERVADLAGQARRIGTPALVRAMEAIGQALVDMREAPDARLLLEVTLVRLCRPEADATPAALLERVDRLERLISGAAVPSVPPAASVAPASQPAMDAPRSSTRPAAAARALLDATPAPSARPAPAPATPEPPPPPEEGRRDRGRSQPPGPSGAASVPPPTRDELTLAWGDHVLARLPQRAKVRFGSGYFAGVQEGFALFALPSAIHRDRCAEVVGEAESALGEHFGRPVRMRLVVGDEVPPAESPPPAPPAGDEEHVDVRDLRDAPPTGVASAVDHVIEAFEGAEVVEE